MPLSESTLVPASPSPPLPPPFAVAIVTYLRFVASERHKGGEEGKWRGFCSHGLVRVARGLVATG